ncbi:MAG: hypothetical protein ISS93_00215 [Candidatus Aenigmarchaeota archaeon]|nr:hypothetical protein [Candidatus Aenigmarchaeota archaeon]
MKVEKHLEILKEVEDEIGSALEDQKGLAAHQRRLAFMISLGITELIELYFHGLKVMKEGSRIKHEWLKKKNVKEILSNQIIKPIESVKEIDKILAITKAIEEKRNDLAYSSPVEEEEILREEISKYFEIKKLIENIVGGFHE